MPWTQPFVPPPKADQFDPSHLAMLFARVLPAAVNLPPAYTFPAPSTAMAFTKPLRPPTPFTGAPSCHPSLHDEGSASRSGLLSISGRGSPFCPCLIRKSFKSKLSAGLILILLPRSNLDEMLSGGEALTTGLAARPAAEAK